MSSKFFDAKLGVYVVMTNTPQPLITPNKFLCDVKNASCIVT